MKLLLTFACSILDLFFTSLLFVLVSQEKFPARQLFACRLISIVWSSRPCLDRVTASSCPARRPKTYRMHSFHFCFHVKDMFWKKTLFIVTHVKICKTQMQGILNGREKPMLRIVCLTYIKNKILPQPGSQGFSAGEGDGTGKKEFGTRLILPVTSGERKLLTVCNNW